MTPQHLLALCSITCYIWSSEAISIQPHFRPIRHEDTVPPEYWWDLTFDHDAPISAILPIPLTPQLIDDHNGDYESRKTDWRFEWARGTSMQWLAGGRGYWTAWVWNSTADEAEVTGGGFIYNETEQGIVAGVNWLQDGRAGAITWNCFVEGNVAGQLPWDTWQLTLDDGTTLGFIKEGWKWGFMRGKNRILSKHCGTGNPVVGKRYKFYNGKEIESSVQRDPFHHTSRVKRSPGFFERVSNTMKEWYQKMKNFFNGDNDDDENAEAKDGDKKCNSFVDLMVRVIDFILGRNRNNNSPGDRPNIPQPPGGVPQGPNGEIPEAGDPPVSADVPPSDAEEIEPEQNNAVRDWE